MSFGNGCEVRRTDSSRLDHVADGESLDCLVLGRAARAVAAADGLHMAAALLVATAGESVSMRFLVRRKIAHPPGHSELRRRRVRQECLGARIVGSGSGSGIEASGRRRECSRQRAIVLVLSLLDHLGGVCEDAC